MSSSKNSCYGDAQQYLQYKHKEDLAHNRYKPERDEYGLLQERSNYGLCYLNGYGQEKDPDDWAGNCMDTNLKYGKNQSRNDRKQMIFVISHPESDTPLLTKEALLEEGKAFVRDNLQGYDALIAVHMDTDNYHIHISCNSVRAVDRPEQPWMMKDRYGCVLHSETAAGCKHQNNPEFRRHCQDWLLDYTRSHGLAVEDNNRVEDQRKLVRYAAKHEKLRQTILDTAAKSHSMEELRTNLYRDHEITLKCRGSTYSVQPPEAKKAIRLDTIDLSTQKLLEALHLSIVERQASLAAQRRELEKKKYIQWIQERRQKNERKAEDTIADAAYIIAGKVQEAGGYYRREDFQELHDLVKQLTYLERDQQTELDKIDRLLDRWKLYADPSTPLEERNSHYSYISWCGCNPKSHAEMQDLQRDHDVVSLRIKEAVAVREALLDCADQWKDHNAESRFYYHETWTLRRQDQLKHQIKAVKANRRKLGDIAYNCQKAADRRIYKDEYLQKAVHFRSLWHDKLLEEKALKQELREVKREVKAIRRRREMER